MTIEHTNGFSTLRHRVIEIALYVSLGGICWLLTWLIIRGQAFADYSIIALCISLASCVGPLLWPFGNKATVQDNLSIMVSMGFRFSVMMGALVISTATKWQHHNSFSICLLGYYFPFLLLQSALLIRNQSIQHPPQS